VFADLDPHTYNLDPRDVAARVTPRTRAVIAVHLAGNACNLAALRELAASKGIALIEDCAQAHGCRYDGRAVGTFGVAGCYSLNEFKHISCGDGGIVVTDDAALAAKLRLCTDKGYSRVAGGPPHRGTTFLANNYRMTELQGAVALAQLEKLDDIVRRRRSWCDRLAAGLRDLPGLELPVVTPRCEPSWWFFMFRVTPVLGASAEQLAEALRAEGVPARAHYIGRCVYDYPLFAEHAASARGTGGGDSHAFAAHNYADARRRCAVAEEILKTCVVLPINEGYSDQDLHETVRAFARVCAWFAGSRP
jgi:dTDP-4-amino-4,6-dideoxygalactose transaminase